MHHEQQHIVMQANPQRTTFIRSFAIVFFPIAIIVYFTFSDLIGIRFTNSDDIVRLLRSFQPYWEFAHKSAVKSGRFFLLYSHIYSRFPYYVWDTPLYDLFLYIPTILIGFLIMYSVVRFAGYFLYGIIFLILYLSFIPLTYQFNLLVSYPLTFTSGIILFISSLFFMNSYFERNKLRYLLFSSFCLLLSFLHYEIFFAIFFIIIMLFIIWKVNIHLHPIGKQFLKKPFIAVYCNLFIYISAFLIWRLIHPSKYSGNQLSFENPHFFRQYMQTFFYYCKASLPLYHFFNNYPLEYIAGQSEIYTVMSIPNNIVKVLQRITLENFLRSSFIALSFLLVISSCKERIRARFLFGVSLIGFIIFVIPPLIIALIPTYQMYVKGGYAPLHITFISYYGFILLLSSFIIYIFQYSTQWAHITRKILAGVMVIGLFWASAISHYFNHEVALHMHRNTQKWRAISALTRYFQLNKACVENATIVAPQLWDIYTSRGSIILPANYWDNLLEGAINLKVKFMKQLPSDNIILSNSIIYLLQFNCAAGKSCTILFSKLDKRPLKGTFVNIITTRDGPLFVSYITNGVEKVVRVNLNEIETTHCFQESLFFGRIIDESIDLRSVTIS